MKRVIDKNNDDWVEFDLNYSYIYLKDNKNFQPSFLC